MDYNRILVKRITDLCRKRGYSINQLAIMSNVSQSTIDNIIQGVSKNPRIQTLHKIALTFNMTISEFLDYSEMNEFSFDEDLIDEAESTHH